MAGARRAFGLHRPGRSLVILPDDVFIASYPKSGNTWTRFLIANLVHPECSADFGNINDLIPDPEGTSKRRLDRMPRPRIIKSHSCFEPRYRRVIYIVRDPRDVVVSQYHYKRKCMVIDDGYPLEKFVTRFLEGDVCQHGSWGENVTSWLVTRHEHPAFLLLHYEDLVSDTVRELSKVASFLGIADTPELLGQAVERSSANQMRKLERAQSQLSTLTKGTRKDLSFVRAAVSGGWRSALPHEQAARIERAWGPIMQFLGYDVTSRQGHEESTRKSVKSVLGCVLR